MPRRLTLSSRRVSYALACALGLVLLACGGGGDVTGPGGNPIPAPQPGPEPTPQPGPEPTPQPDPGITGTYRLTQINNSQPGQLVTVANPDGVVIGLYRFDAGTQLSVDALQRFDISFSYSDDKTDGGFEDQGEVKPAGQAGGSIALVFSSAVYGDAFQGISTDGVIVIEYDFDGDGRPDTTFGFQRVG